MQEKETAERNKISHPIIIPLSNDESSPSQQEKKKCQK
jgi:hypothetical protein